MSSKNIRLRLHIRRHTVPEVKLVWPCAVSDDLTIAKLLSQVNEVVPLEGGEWGLEDYAVELADEKGGSFECLHFQSVGKVFKDDDQVLIRSLLTEDLKRRRLSGRHQISTDGKHLIDGLAFGRPWLRVPRDRPTLELPPRKRARITYDDEDEDDEEDEDYREDEEDQEDQEDEEYEPEQLLLEGPEALETEDPSSVRIRALFEDESDLEDEDEGSEAGGQLEDQADPGPSSDKSPADNEYLDEGDLDGEDLDEEDLDEEDFDEGGLDEELRQLKADNAIIGEDLEQPEKEPSSFDWLSSLNQITTLRLAYPLTSAGTIQSAFVQQGTNLRKTYEALAKTNSPAMSFDEMMDRAVCGVFPGLSQSGLLEEESTVFKGFDGQDSSTGPDGVGGSRRPLIEEVESTDTAEEVEVATVAPLNAIRSSIFKVIANDEESSDESSSLSSEASTRESELESASESEPEEASNSDSSSSSSEASSRESELESAAESESDDDPEPNVEDGGSPTPDARIDVVEDDQSMDSSGSDASDSSEDSDSDSESDSEHGNGAVIDEQAGSAEDSSDSSDDSDSSSDESDLASGPEEETSKPQAQAKTPSAPAPEPTRDSQAAVGTDDSQVAPGQGLTKTQKRNARRREAKRFKQLKALESQSSGANEVGSEDPEFLARKQALLKAFEANVSKDAPNDKPAEAPVDSPKETAALAKVNGKGEGTATVAEASHDQASTSTPSSSESGPRRLKVDMGAGRRMLFKSLGLKNPKSKADEERLRKDLMKDVRPLQNVRVQEPTQTNGSTHDEPDESEDPGGWKEKISYRAVECCHAEMKLSEPPFPFEQRWDPQQRHPRKRKRPSQATYYDASYDDSYYDDDSQWTENVGEWDDSARESKKRKPNGGFEGSYDSPFGNNGDDGEDIVLNYDDAPAKHVASSQFTDMDDLPSLPSDLTTLPTLEFDQVKPGMVIAWQQLLMSKSTGWAPQLATITGFVLSVDDEQTLGVLLAKRDREADDREYDAKTGKRVYEKFEAPADEDDAEDTGQRDLAWGDMFETRLVQQAPTASERAPPARNPEATQNGVSGDNKVSDESQDREENKAEEIDTQEVRAGVEAELMEMAKADNDSPSIPSGQNPPRLELPEIDPFTNVSTDSNKVSSPSRQLEEETSLVGSAEEPAEAPVEHAVYAEDVQSAPMEIDIEDPMFADEPEAIIPDSMPSLEIPMEAKNSRLTPVLEHATLVVPSPVSSIRSGRQLPSNLALGESQDEADKSVIPETTPRAREATPTPRSRAASIQSSTSSSPFPSLEEIYHTCATSRQTQSPIKLTQQSLLRSFMAHGKHDSEYEEAMRRLDEGDEESDHEVDRNKSIHTLFPNATQPEPSVELPRLPSPKLEEPTTPVRTKLERASPFKIPPGSQVVAISSSPASLLFSEDYANDSIDETYQDSPLPRGSGWVQKREARNMPRQTRSCGKSVPAVSKDGGRRIGLNKKPINRKGSQKTTH